MNKGYTTFGLILKLIEKIILKYPSHLDINQTKINKKIKN